MNDRVVNIHVKRMVVDESLPDPYDLAKKYDVEFDEDDIASEDEKTESCGLGNHLGDNMSREIYPNLDIAKRTEGLILKLDDKNKEIERLCFLLEALEPVPGLDAEKFMSINDGTADETLVDYRDSKIVQLAKKCRKLTVALNKERGQGAGSKQFVNDLKKKCEDLQNQLNMVASPAARAAAQREQKESKDDLSRDMQRELQQAQKQVDEWRKKCSQSQEEVKKLQRILTKELGEGVTIEEAVDEGWRGRAQQIVMLKTKIKRLESGEKTSATSRTKASDVDAKAQEELSAMSQDRQQAIDAITEDYSRLSEECQQTRQKCEAQKARIRNLESEAAKHKAQMKVLVEKTETDDEFVDALRVEVDRLRTQLEKQLEKEKAANAGPRVVKVAGTGSGTNTGSSTKGSEEEELNRLRRLCQQQAQQLETQDKVIRQLRNVTG